MTTSGAVPGIGCVLVYLMSAFFWSAIAQERTEPSDRQVPTILQRQAPDVSPLKKRAPVASPAVRPRGKPTAEPRVDSQAAKTRLTPGLYDVSEKARRISLIAEVKSRTGTKVQFYRLGPGIFSVTEAFKAKQERSLTRQVMAERDPDKLFAAVSAPGIPIPATIKALSRDVRAFRIKNPRSAPGKISAIRDRAQILQSIRDTSSDLEGLQVLGLGVPAADWVPMDGGLAAAIGEEVTVAPPIAVPAQCPNEYWYSQNYIGTSFWGCVQGVSLYFGAGDLESVWFSAFAESGPGTVTQVGEVKILSRLKKYIYVVFLSEGQGYVWHVSVSGWNHTKVISIVQSESGVYYDHSGTPDW
jgi:hypothetical protein